MSRRRFLRLAENEFRRLYRAGGCDPEIACLRSLSASARARMQLRRDLRVKAELAEMDETILDEMYGQLCRSDIDD